MLLLYSNELELDSLDIMIVLHIASYWWENDRLPHPSKARIAAALNVAPRTVQRRIQALEAKGYIKRKVRKTRFGDNDTNEYDLSGLTKEVRRLGAREKDRDAARAKDDLARVATPKAASLQLLKGRK